MGNSENSENAYLIIEFYSRLPACPRRNDQDLKILSFRDTPPHLVSKNTNRLILIRRKDKIQITEEYNNIKNNADDIDYGDWFETVEILKSNNCSDKKNIDSKCVTCDAQAYLSALCLCISSIKIQIS